MTGRKRRAPGASPLVGQQQDLQNNIFAQDARALSTEPYIGSWNEVPTSADISAGFSDASLYNGNTFTGNLGASSGQLVRRNPNQQLAARGRSAWDAFNAEAVSGQQANWENTDDDDELEQKALLAKKDAQAKRKQIPPFVQKLSSFLDEKNNENLIRWSDDGNSFIVLDEDEFARTLIPELFKHNNYASFVRQLNMYGFHKKVGLSDNSMKASETKAKAPSEYYNKYFKRGRPELLWLIQKPKNSASNPKRKREEESVKQGDSDDDGRRYTIDAGGSSTHPGEDGGAPRHQEMAMIPRTEYNSLRGEVRALQQQQKIISNVLNRIRQQNDQLYQQATAFQALHDRHENSINAILTFLATFYNRSLEGNHGPNMNIADMFSSPLSQAPQTHGSVVDVGDYQEKSTAKSPQLHRTVKRPLALLPAPAVKDAKPASDRATTLSPSARSTGSTITKSSQRPSVFKPAASSTKHTSQASAAFTPQPTVSAGSPFPAKVDAAGTPQPFIPIPANEEIMSAIQNMNANTSQDTSGGPGFDFSSVLTHYQTANGNVPLTQQQRNSVLSHIASSTDAISPTASISQNNNALVSPQPPPMPSLDHFAETQNQLDMLQKMSEEQDSRVHQLQQRLEPLSPSGTIPGLTDNSYFSGHLPEPSAYDIDMAAYVNSDDFFTPTQNGVPVTATDGPDLGFSGMGYEVPTTGDSMQGLVLEHHNGQDGQEFTSADLYQQLREAVGGGGGRVESVSSAAPSPVADEEIAIDEELRSPKRIRTMNK